MATTTLTPRSDLDESFSTNLRTPRTTTAATAPQPTRSRGGGSSSGNDESDDILNGRGVRILSDEEMAEIKNRLLGDSRNNDDPSSGSRGSRDDAIDDGSTDAPIDPVGDADDEGAGISNTYEKLSAAIAELESKLAGSRKSFEGIGEWLGALSTCMSSIKSLSKFDSASLALAEKLMDNIYNFAVTSYTNDYNLQMWYLQQAYNTPESQMERLAEAGLSSAFITGGLDTGNASTSATGSSAPLSQNANLGGQANAQQQSNTNTVLGAVQGAAGMVSALGGAGSAFGSLMSSLASAEATRQLTPAQIANVNSDTIFKQISSSKALEDMDQLRQVQLRDNYQLETANAQNEVNLAQAAKDTTSQYAFSEIEETKYVVNVREKGNRTRKVEMSAEEITAAAENGWRTTDGSQIVDSNGSNIQVGGNLSLSAGSTIVGLSGETGINASTGSNKSHSNTSTSSDENNGSASNSKKGSNSLTYDTEGNLRIGDTTFYQKTCRRKVLNEQYRKEWESRCKRLQDAIDNYNSLTNGERAKAFREMQQLTKGAYKYRTNRMLDHYYRLLHP